MNIFAISGFINGISAVIFGLIVYFKNPKQSPNRTFVLMTFSLAIWCFGYGFWQLSKNYESALFWIRILSIGSTFIPVFFLHWIFSLFNFQKKKEWILVGAYLITLFFLSFISSPLYIKEITPQLSFFWWPQAGIVYTLYIIFSYFGMIGYITYELIKLFKKTNGYLHEQIKYILFAMIVGFGGGATNFLLWYGIHILPYGNFLVFLYPLILTFAITRYHLFEIKVILTEILVAVIAVILAGEIFVFETIQAKFLGSGIFFLFCIFGYILIKTTNQEIERRQELQKAYAELEKLDKAKTEFVSIASHQLRTPLAAVKGYVSMLLEKSYGTLTEKMEKPLKNIYDSNERLIKLVNDLLNFSRIESGKIEIKLEETSINEVIVNTVEELKGLAEKKNLYLRFEKPEKDLPKIPFDAEKIRQAISNIIDNAIHYTTKGGITVRCKIENNKCKIEISDTGEGMTKEEIIGLFNSFNRGTAGTRFWTEGAGLGLYVAKKFVEIHNGRIWAESRGKEKGSVFYIELPIKVK